MLKSRLFWWRLRSSSEITAVIMLELNSQGKQNQPRYKKKKKKKERKEKEKGRQESKQPSRPIRY